MADNQGVSKSTVNNIWRAHKLQPHRRKTFKLSSRDPKFLEKMTDVVGLYLNPPQQALVLCVDEKRQIQALDRTQPGLPIKKGRCGAMTHDYKPNGATTLFAALETLQGKVVGECYSRHRHQEFLRFLRRIETEFPGDVPLHLVMDNYGAHKHAKVNAWLKRRLHFVPTSSSWLNLVERWFGHLDSKATAMVSSSASPICRQPSRPSCGLGINPPNHSSGLLPSNPSKKSSPAAVKHCNRSSQAARAQTGESGKRLSNYLADTTLDGCSVLGHFGRSPLVK